MDKLAGIIKEIQGDRTQAELAAAIGVTQAMVSQYKRGLAKPGTETIAALLRIAEPEQQRALLELFGIKDIRQFANALLESAGVPTADVQGTIGGGNGKEAER